MFKRKIDTFIFKLYSCYANFNTKLQHVFIINYWFDFFRMKLYFRRLQQKSKVIYELVSFNSSNLSDR